MRIDIGVVRDSPKSGAYSELEVEVKGDNLSLRQNVTPGKGVGIAFHVPEDFGSEVKIRITPVLGEDE